MSRNNKEYIYQGESATDAWLGTNSFHDSALAGYKALRLISVTEPDFISTISAEVWKKWAAIILDFPNAREDKNKEIRQQLIKRAYQNAPDELIRVLIILIDRENAQHGSIDILHEIRCCWDERLAEFLLTKVKDKKLKARSTGNLVKELLVHRVDRAKAFAKSLISLPPPTDGEARAKAIVAAKMLMLYSEDAGWSVVWSAIQQDPKFGREVLEAVSYAVMFKVNIEQRIKEDCLADLYIFLAQQYPTLPEDSIRMWKDCILKRLQELGTQNVIEERTKKMEDEPKIEKNINISNSPINAPVGTSGVTNSNVTIASSDAKKGVNLANLIAGIGIIVTMSVSGAFNQEFKEWFNRIFSANVEQQPVPKSE